MQNGGGRGFQIASKSFYEIAHSPDDLIFHSNCYNNYLNIDTRSLISCLNLLPFNKNDHQSFAYVEFPSQ